MVSDEENEQFRQNFGTYSVHNAYGGEIYKSAAILNSHNFSDSLAQKMNKWIRLCRLFLEKSYAKVNANVSNFFSFIFRAFTLIP